MDPPNLNSGEGSNQVGFYQDFTLQRWVQQRQALREMRAVIEQAERNMEYDMEDQIRLRNINSNSEGQIAPQLLTAHPTDSYAIQNSVSSFPARPMSYVHTPQVMDGSARIIEIENVSSPPAGPFDVPNSMLIQSNGVPSQINHSPHPPMSDNLAICQYLPATVNLSQSHHTLNGVQTQPNQNYALALGTHAQTVSGHANGGAHYIPQPTQSHTSELPPVPFLLHASQGETLHTNVSSDSHATRSPSSYGSHGDATGSIYFAIPPTSMQGKQPIQAETSEPSPPPHQRITPLPTSLEETSPASNASGLISVPSATAASPSREGINASVPVETHSVPVNILDAQEASTEVPLSPLAAINELLADHGQWSEDASSRILQSIWEGSNESATEVHPNTSQNGRVEELLVSSNEEYSNMSQNEYVQEPPVSSNEEHSNMSQNEHIQEPPVSSNEEHSNMSQNGRVEEPPVSSTEEHLNRSQNGQVPKGSSEPRVPPNEEHSSGPVPIDSNQLPVSSNALREDPGSQIVPTASEFDTTLVTHDNQSQAVQIADQPTSLKASEFPAVVRPFSPRTPIKTGPNSSVLPSSASANKDTLGRDILRALQPPSTKRKRSSLNESNLELPVSKRCKNVPSEPSSMAILEDVNPTIRPRPEASAGLPQPVSMSSSEQAANKPIQTQSGQATNSQLSYVAYRPQATAIVPQTQPLAGPSNYQPGPHNAGIQTPLNNMSLATNIPSHQHVPPYAGMQTPLATNIPMNPSQNYYPQPGFWSTQPTKPYQYQFPPVPRQFGLPPQMQHPPLTNQGSVANGPGTTMIVNTPLPSLFERQEQSYRGIVPINGSTSVPNSGTSALSSSETVVPPPRLPSRQPLFLPSTPSPPVPPPHLPSRQPLFLPSTPSPPPVPISPERPSNKTPFVELASSPLKLKWQVPPFKSGSTISSPNRNESKPESRSPAIGGSAVPKPASKNGVTRSAKQVYVSIPKLRGIIVAKDSEREEKASASEQRVVERRRYDNIDVPEIADFARRMVRRPCLWKNCHAVLDSAEKLIKHTKLTHGKGDNGIYRCQWAECHNTSPYAESDQLIHHLRLHVQARIYCAYEDCEFQTQLAGQLAEHLTKDHDPDFDNLSRYAIPHDAELPTMPPPVDQVPAYLSVSIPVTARRITLERHQRISPMILHRIFKKVDAKRNAMDVRLHSPRSRRHAISAEEAAQYAQDRDGYRLIRKDVPSKIFASLVHLPPSIDEVDLVEGDLMENVVIIEEEKLPTAPSITGSMNVPDVEGASNDADGVEMGFTGPGPNLLEVLTVREERETVEVDKLL